MRYVIFGVMIWLGFAAPLRAQDMDIRAIIGAQLQAFKRDDFATAFEFASPRLQQLFRSPQVFEKMVTQGYPMVWRPGDVRFLELDLQGDKFLQRLMITDQSGRVHILEYRMLETDAGWRIGGVQILDSSDFNV